MLERPAAATLHTRDTIQNRRTRNTTVVGSAVMVPSSPHQSRGNSVRGEFQPHDTPRSQAWLAARTTCTSLLRWTTAATWGVRTVCTRSTWSIDAGTRRVILRVLHHARPPLTTALGTG